MTTTAWAHVSNAEYIDRLVALFPTYLAGVTYLDRGKELRTAWDNMRKQEIQDAWLHAWQAVSDYLMPICSEAAWDIATDAVLALINQPDCAYILDLHPDVVRLMAASGNQPAILMDRAVRVMHGETV